MATIIPFPQDDVADDELAIQLWELTMAGERSSDAFMRIDSQLHRRSLLGTHRGSDRSSQARFGAGPS
jgi:hypothetical protein